MIEHMSDMEISHSPTVSVAGGKYLAKKKIKIKKKLNPKKVSPSKAIYDIAHDSMKRFLPGVF